MAVTTLAAFWAVSVLFVLTPGADWAYAIAAGLRHRSVLPAVGGMLTGHLLATAFHPEVSGPLGTTPVGLMSRCVA